MQGTQTPPDRLGQLDTDVQQVVKAINRVADLLPTLFIVTPTPPPSVSGSRGGNAALASLLTALAGLGVITDNTTP